ncbi:hypothetical protein CLOLEP_03743 [[Clostridium] leptum DSM 753]|uniref:Uncharacterized protein n=1 Tax=[Clostridium] leptum DSM 753 TaxID=428125 RepID=A7VYR5_9FIRM|nr:hypothetical protein CLOLEP_03743 [[Clostridium] leptum DSM 753]
MGNSLSQGSAENRPVGGAFRSGKADGSGKAFTGNRYLTNQGKASFPARAAVWFA